MQEITEYDYHNGHRVNTAEIQLPGESEPVPYQRWASPLVCRYVGNFVAVRYVHGRGQRSVA